MATDPTATPSTDRAKPKRAVKKVRDPNRTPVKRERSELHALVTALEQARKKRAALVKRVGAMGRLQALLEEQDAVIVRLSERMRGLMDGAQVAASEPVVEQGQA